MVGDSFAIGGRFYRLPVPILGIPADGERAIAGVIPSRATRVGDDVLTYEMTDDAADLTLARSGRAPLLVEHMRRLDAIIGAISAVWAEDGSLYFTARLAPIPEADRIWALLSGGFPVSISFGTEILAADVTGEAADGAQLIRVRRWRLDEISAVPFGSNSEARMVGLRTDEGRALLATRKPSDARVIGDRLCLDRWRHWVRPAATRMAEKLGLDQFDVKAALSKEVQQHAEQLIADLAA